jgi:hypothetical protein
MYWHPRRIGSLFGRWGAWSLFLEGFCISSITPAALNAHGLTFLDTDASLTRSQSQTGGPRNGLV